MTPANTQFYRSAADGIRRRCRRCHSESCLASKWGTPRPAVLKAPKTHCPRGHKYTERTVRWVKNGRGVRHRRCRLCEAIARDKYRHKQRSAALSEVRRRLAA